MDEICWLEGELLVFSEGGDNIGFKGGMSDFGVESGWFISESSPMGLVFELLTEEGLKIGVPIREEEEVCLFIILGDEDDAFFDFSSTKLGSLVELLLKLVRGVST